MRGDGKHRAPIGRCLRAALALALISTTTFALGAAASGTTPRPRLARSPMRPLARPAFRAVWKTAGTGGWAFVAVGAAVRLARTVDGGRHWTDVTPAPSVSVMALAPLGGNRAWVVTWGPDAGLVVDTTRDGGRTWRQGRRLDRKAAKVSLAASGAYGVLEVDATPVRIFVTTDGGRRWRTASPKRGTFPGFGPIVVASSSRLYLTPLAHPGHLDTSADGGKNWSPVTLGGPALAETAGPAFTKDEGLVVGFEADRDGVGLATTDGRRWTYRSTTLSSNDRAATVVVNAKTAVLLSDSGSVEALTVDSKRARIRIKTSRPTSGATDLMAHHRLAQASFSSIQDGWALFAPLDGAKGPVALFGTTDMGRSWHRLAN